ncbi:hypothetical protein AWENTII_004833 [Aspergillus wentii]
MDLQDVKMGEPNINRKSWESFSSGFSNLEISISQDSCYASDEVSVASNNPNTTGKPTSSSSSSTPASDSSHRTYPKSILKKPSTDLEEDSECESGYGSDASDFGYDALSEESDDDDEDMYEVAAWDDASDIMSDTYDDDDDDESLDGSFIAFEFESMVRFDTNVHYIEAPEPSDDEGPDTEMTCHELMELARNSGSLQLVETEYPSADLMDDGEDDHNHGPNADRPEEHTRDVVDLDKRIFVAYMNGINGIADSQYKSHLRARVDEIKMGRTQPQPMEAISTNGVYLEHVLNHVIGVFGNLVAKEELDELVHISEEKGAQVPSEQTENSNQALLGKIECLLSERLANDQVDVGEDELSFFAGGVACALENGNICASE